MSVPKNLLKREIIFLLFGSDQRLRDFLFEPLSEPSLRDSPEAILNDCWDLNLEHQLLVRAALDIWSGTGQLFLSEALTRLSEQNFSRLLSSLARYHHNREHIAAASDSEICGVIR